jgi:hypothetical protein
MLFFVIISYTPYFFLKKLVYKNACFEFPYQMAED